MREPAVVAMHEGLRSPGNPRLGVKCKCLHEAHEHGDKRDALEGRVGGLQPRRRLVSC